MKKFTAVTAFLLSMVLVLSLAACSADTDEDTDASDISEELATADDTDTDETEPAVPPTQGQGADPSDNGSGNRADDDGISSLPLNIQYEIEDIIDGVVILHITNYSGDEFIYDEYFTLEAEDEDDWLEMERIEDVTWTDLAYVLEDGEDTEVECDLNPFGDLLDGHYRITKEDISVDFWLESGFLFIQGDPDGK